MPKDLQKMKKVFASIEMCAMLTGIKRTLGSTKLYLGAVEVDDWNIILIGLEPRLVACRGNIDFFIFKLGLFISVHTQRKALINLEKCSDCHGTSEEQHIWSTYSRPCTLDHEFGAIAETAACACKEGHNTLHLIGRLCGCSDSAIPCS